MNNCTKPSEVDYFMIPMIPDMKLRRRLDFPEVEFEIDKVKYKATDLRLLNNYAIRAIDWIMLAIENSPDIERVAIDVSGLEESDIFAIEEIITGLNFTAKKTGRNGFTVSSHLLSSGCEIRENEDEHLLIFNLDDKARIQAIHNYLKSTKKHEYIEIIKVCAEAVKNRFDEFMKQRS